MACFVYAKKELKLSSATVSIYCHSGNFDEEKQRLIELTKTLNDSDRQLLDEVITEISLEAKRIELYASGKRCDYYSK